MGRRPLRTILWILPLVAVAACGGAGSRPDASATTARAAASTVATIAPVTTASASTAASIAPVTTETSVAGTSEEEAFVPCQAGGAATPAVAGLVLESGDVAWSTCSTADAWRYLLGATDDTVFVASTLRDHTGSVSAFDAHDGRALWTRSTVPGAWGWPEGPVAGRNTVVVQVADGPAVAVIGVDARTGAERWRLAAAERLLPTSTSPPPAVGPPQLGPPATPVTPIANTTTTAVLASISGVRGVDRATGTTRWSLGLWVQDQASTGVARSPAAVIGEVVLLPVAGPDQGGLVAIDATEGRELWRSDALDHPTGSGAVAVGYQSREAPDSSEVIAVSVSDGARRWSSPGLPSYGDLWAVGDDVVVVRTTTGIVAYDATTGVTRWTRTGGPDLPGEPQVVAGALVVLLWESTVGALSISTGATVWASRLPLDSPMMSSVAANASMVFVSVNSAPWTD